MSAGFDWRRIKIVDAVKVVEAGIAASIRNRAVLRVMVEGRDAAQVTRAAELLAALVEPVVELRITDGA
jgi:hypothetical protein